MQQVVEIRGQSGSTWVAIIRIREEELHHKVGEVASSVWYRVCQGGHSPTRVLTQKVAQLDLRERRPTCQALVEHATQGEQVGAAVDPVVPCELLGCRIGNAFLGCGREGVERVPRSRTPID
jgi:hypothetical protein